MSTLLIAELNAAYASAIDNDRLEEWPDFFVEDCLYKITSVENHRRGYAAGIVYADSRAMLRDRVTALRRANIYERQRYRHIIGLPLVSANGAGGITAETPFLVVRIMRDGSSDLFATGVYLDTDAGRGVASPVRRAHRGLRQRAFRHAARHPPLAFRVSSRPRCVGNVPIKRRIIEALPQALRNIAEPVDRALSQARAVIEHPFHIVKNRFRHKKLGYRGFSTSASAQVGMSSSRRNPDVSPHPTRRPRRISKAAETTASAASSHKSATAIASTRWPRGAHRSGSVLPENSTTTAHPAAAARWQTPVSLPTVSAARCASAPRSARSDLPGQIERGRADLANARRERRFRRGSDNHGTKARLDRAPAPGRRSARRASVFRDDRAMTPAPAARNSGPPAQAAVRGEAAAARAEASDKSRPSEAARPACRACAAGRGPGLRADASSATQCPTIPACPAAAARHKWTIASRSADRKPGRSGFCRSRRRRRSHPRMARTLGRSSTITSSK